MTKTAIAGGGWSYRMGSEVERNISLKVQF